MSRRPLSRLIAVGAAALFLACQPAGQQERAEWRVVSSEELTADQILKHDRAIAARDAMFQSLKGRLMEVVGTSGPAAAIDVCAEEAPLIAKRISEAHGLSIGRTSFRLRNPNNVPPAWAASLVSDRVEEPTILARDGSLGVLFPIRLQAECVVCHGPPDGIPPAVADALAKHYPDDAATGFQLGDLRGWFWVDVPPVETSRAGG